MHYATHGTAEAMLAQGILKDFVLEIILQNTTPNIVFNPWDNPYSLGEMAFKYAKEKKFELSNECLQRLIEVGEVIPPPSRSALK